VEQKSRYCIFMMLNSVNKNINWRRIILSIRSIIKFCDICR